MNKNNFRKPSLIKIDYLYLCHEQTALSLSACRREESPDNTGHCTPERGDVREGMGAEKKITTSIFRGKGEKVG